MEKINIFPLPKKKKKILSIDLICFDGNNSQSNSFMSESYQIPISKFHFQSDKILIILTGIFLERYQTYQDYLRRSVANRSLFFSINDQRQLIVINPILSETYRLDLFAKFCFHILKRKSISA